MSNLNKLKVVDFTAGRISSDDINTNIPFADNFEKTRTIQQANAVIGAYVNRNYTDMQNKADKDEIPTKLSELENDEGYITSGDIPSKTSDLTNDGENGIDPFITNQVNDLANYTNNTNLTTLLNNKASTTDLNNVKSAIDYKSTDYVGDLVVESIRSKNIFNYKMGSFEHSGTDVSLLDNGIKVTVNDSNATFPRANYFILDILNHLGENITLSSTIDINSTAHPRIAIGTCDSTGGNRDILSYTDTETNGRKSVTTTLPTSVTPNTRYMFIGFYCSHGTKVSSGNYVNFTDIQLEFSSEATTYSTYQELNNQENYSTSEIKIGIWIDGKPLYRKVIKDTVPITPANGTTVQKSILIDNNSDSIIINTFQIKTSTDTIPCYLYETNSGYKIKTLVSNKNIIIYNSATAFNGADFIGVVEYTKTTD